MPVDQIITDFDATFSWHGFCHQGKVALLLALIKIKELIGGNSSRSVSVEGWELELEWVQDISIINPSNIRESIHQVKTNKTISVADLKYGGNKSIITKLKTACISNNVPVDKGHLHLTCSHEISSAQIEGISIYEYPDGSRFCSYTPEDKIKEHITEQIMLLKPNLQDSIYEQIYCCLLRLIDDHVAIRHQKHGQGNNDPEIIKLQNIHDIVDSELDELLSQWSENNFKHTVCNKIDNYYSNLSNSSSDRVKLQLIKEIIDKISLLKPPQLISFCNIICLDCKYAEKTGGEFSILPKFKDAFIKIIKELEQTPLELENGSTFPVFVYKSDGINYLISDVVGDRDSPEIDVQYIYDLAKTNNERLNIIPDTPFIITLNCTTNNNSIGNIVGDIGTDEPSIKPIYRVNFKNLLTTKIINLEEAKQIINSII